MFNLNCDKLKTVLIYFYTLNNLSDIEWISSTPVNMQSLHNFLELIQHYYTRVVLQTTFCIGFIIVVTNMLQWKINY